MERAVVLCQRECITLDELPDKVKKNGGGLKGSQVPHTLKTSLEDFERSFIANAYSSQEKNKEETARTLGIDLATLYRKLKKYEIGD